MSKISTGQMRAQLETISKKLSAGYTDQEIMSDLHISRPTFYRYKSKIFKMCGDTAAKKTESSIEHEADLLKDRYIRLFRRLELKMNEPGNDLADTALASEVAGYLATNILKLEVEGLRARQGRWLQYNEQKAIRYIGNVPRRLSEPDYTPSKEDDEDPGDPTEQRDNSTQTKVF